MAENAGHREHIENEMDRFQAMATFVTVVETGGFASAARKLDVSPSVVSRVVTDLEERLGVRLLTRTTRVVRLTDAGTAYFEDCRRILGEVDDAELAATGTHSSPRGLLTVTAPVLFGKYYVMPVVTDYLALPGNRRERVVHRPRGESGGRGHRRGSAHRRVAQFDVAGDQRWPRAARAVRVARLPEAARRAAPPRRPGRAHDDPRERHLDDPQWRLHEGDRQVLVRLQPRLTTTTNDSAIAAAAAGFGITRLLSYQVARHLRNGTLQIVLAEFEPPALPIHVVHREGRHAAQKVRAFLDLAIDTLRADPSLN